MIFGHKYKNNKINENKYVDVDKENDFISNLKDLNNIDVNENERLDKALDVAKEAKKEIIDDIMKLKFSADPHFDSELYKALDNLHGFISNYIPNYPKYYDDDGNINPKALLDSRDIIKNELPLSIDEIINSTNTYTGIVNETKIHLENGYSIDSDGNVYNSDRKVVFASHEPSEKVKYLDLLNGKLVTVGGIRLDLPKDFFDKYITNKNFKATYLKKKKQRDDLPENERFASNIVVSKPKVYAVYCGVPIYEGEKELVELKVDDLYIGDIFDDVSEKKRIDLINQLKRYNKEYKNLGICNFKDIPYAELNSLIFWGGGERGVKPLASNDISSKDIIFKPDGSVVYSGMNSTISTGRAGCPSKSYKTGHICMYSDSNKMGVKRGIIQYIYRFCDMFGLFSANIPPLLGYKHFKIFPGLCIGGLLEMGLCKWQEKISTRINELFKCIPADFKTDDSESGFENNTFVHGCSVKTLEELDTIKSCKVGDKYVVSVVPQSVTGGKNPACGIFVYDPEDIFEPLYSWKYKSWKGKPFVEDEVPATTKESTLNMYNNPAIQDILMQENTLGQDSISRRLMELQYAYLKKEALLSINDVKYSLEALIESSISEMMDKLTYQISNFLEMKHHHETVYKLHLSKFNHTYNSSTSSIYIKYESKEYIDYFLKHFEYLTKNGHLKEIPLDKCRREQDYYSSSKDSGAQALLYKEIYYVFDGYDKNEYLIPERNNVIFYDKLMFSKLFIPTNEIIETLKNNANYLKMISGNSGGIENIRTIKDFLNMSGNKEGYDINIKTYLTYKERELAYNGFSPEAFDEVKERCYYTINNANVFKGEK